MKHFYTFIIALLATAISSTVQAGTYTLNIDDPSHVIVKVNDIVKSDLTAGDNDIEINLNDYNYISVSSAPGFLIKKAVDKDGNEYYISNNTANLSANPYTSESQLYCAISTISEEEVYTAKLNVTIDNFEAAYIRTYSGREIRFTQNEQVVLFDPTTETQMQVGGVFNPTTYQTSKVYSVKLNGENITAQYGSYTFSAKDGDKLEITTTPPDVDYKYTLTEEDETGFITGVTVDGVAIEDFTKFEAHAGSTITISANTSEYILEKADFGSGITTYVSWPYTFTAEADADIKIWAHKPSSFTVSFTIDDANNVEIWQDQNKLDIVSGTQDLTFNEDAWGNTPYINIKASSNGIITSVKKNGQEIYSSYGTYTQVSKNDIFVITTEKTSRDWKTAVYVDGFDNSYFFSFENPSRQTVATLTDGYTLFNFGSVDLPISLAFQPKNSSAASVFINDERISSLYEGSYNYSLQPQDGDVIKIFINGEPEMFDLSFDMPENTEGISVRRDHITEITDFTSTSSAHAGTVYHVTVPDAENYEAKAGDQTLTFDAEKTASFTPGENMVLTVTAKSSGIEDVDINNGASKEIYNLQGIRINGDANNLPAGIYIIGGKKVLVK